MKVLAISYALPPMQYPQATQIGRLLSHSALDIQAVSGGHEPDTAGFDACVKRTIVPFTERRGMLHMLGLRAVPFYAALPDAFRAWTAAAYSVIRANLYDNRPDVIATFGEPMSDHLLGLRLKREFGIPWLAHFSDPWSDNPFRTIQPLSKWANRYLERRVIDAADMIVFTSQETLDLVCRKYDASVRARAMVLPHAYDPKGYPIGEVPAASRSIVLRYIGNFYGHRTPRPLVEALAHLIEVDPDALCGVRVEIIGGMPPRMFSRTWRSLPAGLLVHKPNVPYAASLRLMTSTDILLTIDAPASESVFFPSKLADYIGAGVRLVGIVPPGAAARIIAECGGASVSPAAPVPQIAALLRSEIRAVRSQKGIVPSSRALGSRYDIARVAPAFDDMCKATIEFAEDRGLRR